MRTIRASEIGVFLYCQRAWWYQLQGVKPENQLELSSGTTFHHQHGRRVLTAGLLRLAAWVLLMLAVIIAAFFITTTWLV
jgi:hypothetical protein